MPQESPNQPVPQAPNNTPAENPSDGLIEPSMFEAFMEMSNSQGSVQPTPVEPESQDFNEQLKKHLGMDINDIRALRDTVYEMRRERDLETLKGIWGDAYEQNVKVVTEALSKMPPEKQALYNNVQGAQYLAEYFAMGAQVSQNPVYQPSGNTPVAPTGGGKTKMTGSEYNALSPEEKTLRWDELQYMAQAGLIDWSR